MALARPKIIVILGPTASGKSTLAVNIARFLGAERSQKKFGIEGAEIISADSRQVYRGMDIGTGKVPRDKSHVKGQMSDVFYSSGIPHHLLDITSPKKNFTVVDYQRLAKQAIKKILKKNKIPIICGGTGFYIDAALYDYALPEVKANPKLRRMLEKQSPEALFEKLASLDPERAKHIDRHNKRRLIRALEIVITTGKPVPSPEEAQKKTSPYAILKIGIRPTDKKLKANIHRRLLARLKQGMIGEARRLHVSGVSWRRLDDFGLEYRYMSRYLRGITTREAMVAELEKAIRRYAKRQMTWFKRDGEIHWIRSKREVRKLSLAFLCGERKS